MIIELVLLVGTYLLVAGCAAWVVRASVRHWPILLVRLLARVTFGRVVLVRHYPRVNTNYDVLIARKVSGRLTAWDLGSRYWLRDDGTVGEYGTWEYLDRQEPQP